MIKYYCPKCKKVVRKETDKKLKKEYPYFCSNCDENFYKFEVVCKENKPLIPLHKRKLDLTKAEIKIIKGNCPFISCKYKKAYNILMEYWDSLPDEEKPKIDRKLKKLGL